MAARRLVLTLIAASAACGGDPSVCGEPIACQDLSGEPGWMSGSMEALPADFPEPPVGAELCGQSGEAPTATVHFVIDRAAVVHEHYRVALDRIGWTATGPVAAVESPDAGSEVCETEQLFTMGDPLVAVRVFPARGAFTLSVFNLDN